MRENTKTCPLCRTKSLYVVPSPHFPTPPSQAVGAEENKENIGATDGHPNTHGASASNVGTISITNGNHNTPEPQQKPNPEKDKIIQNYLRRKKQIPCKYFEDCVSRWRDYNAQRNAQVMLNHSPPRQDTPFRPRCRFANDCHYAHLHPETRQPYVFSAEDLRRMEDNRRIRVFRSTRRWNGGMEGNFLQLLSELGLPIPATHAAAEGPEYNNLAYDGFERRDRIVYHNQRDQQRTELVPTVFDEEQDSMWEENFSDPGLNHDDFGGFPSYDDDDNEALWSNVDDSDDDFDDYAGVSW